MRLTACVTVVAMSIVVLSAHQAPRPIDRAVNWPAEPSDVFIRGVTPDGHGLVFVDLDTGLHLRDLRTGAVMRLIRTEDEIIEAAAVSKNGKSVAFLVSGVPDDRLGLHIAPTANTTRISRRAIVPRAWVYPREWSADDRMLLVDALGETDVSGRRIGVVTVADGRLRILKTMPGRGLGRMSLHPDGSLIAYDYPPAAPPYQRRNPNFDPLAPLPSARDVYLLPTDGSPELRLDEPDASDSVVGWAADGRNLIVVRTVTTSQSIWALPVTRSGLSGEPRLLYADFDGVPLGLSAAGDLIYGRQQIQNAGSAVIAIRIIEGLLDRRPTQ